MYDVTLRRYRVTNVVVEKRVFLVLVTQHAMFMHHIFVCGLPGCAISQTARFWEKLLVNIKMCFDFLCNMCLKTFLIRRRTEQKVIKNLFWS